MKRYRKWFSGLRLHNKLIVAIYTVLFPVLIASTVVLYRFDYRATLRENTRLYEHLAQNVCRQVAAMQADMQDIATYFAVNSDVMALLSGSEKEVPESALIWDEETPTSFLQNILAIKSHIKVLALYPENGYPPFFISRDASVHRPKISGIRSLEIYEKAVNARGDIQWDFVPAYGTDTPYQKNHSDKIIAYRELYNLSKTRRLGFFVIGMDASDYQRICREALYQSGDCVLIFSGEGQEFVRVGEADEEDIAAIAEAAAEGRLEGLDTRRAHVFACADEETGVQVFYISAIKSWRSQASRSLLLALTLAMALIAVSAPLSGLMSRITLRSTRQLSEAMSKFQSGDFDQEVAVSTDDEIGDLSRTFNAMAHDIRDLINKTYLQQLREREIQLDVLQAQINPHFLYNAMNSLYWQAEGAGNEGLAENILALSQLFRLVLNQGSSTMRVRDEARLVECYLQVQKMRIGERLQYSIRIDPALNEIRIPKLTLQPLVENAVVHGIEQAEKGGTITITGEKLDGVMRFTVADNGAGMDQEAAQRMLRETSAPGSGGRVAHYALSNIRQRLALEYGTEDPITIESAPGRGVTVILTMPLTGSQGAGEAAVETWKAEP